MKRIHLMDMLDFIHILSLDLKTGRVDACQISIGRLFHEFTPLFVMISMRNQPCHILGLANLTKFQIPLIRYVVRFALFCVLCFAFYVVWFQLL